MSDLLYGVPDPVSLGLPPVTDEGVPKCDSSCSGDGKLFSLLHPRILMLTLQFRPSRKPSYEATYVGSEAEIVILEHQF